MADTTRRQAIGSILLGAGVAAAPNAAQAQNCSGDWSGLTWPRGVEGQRKADRSDGTYLNPVLAGDHPDPTILQDGGDYYMTHSSFDSYPGIVIWHSRDLVNWSPIGPALTTPIGSVWACDLVKHRGRYFIYIPARAPERRSIYVIHARDIHGPWSAPIDLDLPHHIDPGHVVGEDGKRYLFLSGGDRVRLSDDGLSRIGEPEHVYDPWRYPEDWVVESFSPEGPKLTRYGEYFYMITAVGGTAGPPTGHMVIAARSRSINGPWENCPHNPLVRTQSASEKWWSRGHASLVEGPGGAWYALYHGYENGFWTLGRQTLLDPVAWDDDGWPRMRGGDLSAALPKPRGEAVPHGVALSDDFSANKFGLQWAFYDPATGEQARARFEDGALVVQGKGTSPADCSPITCIAGDQAYRCAVEIELDGAAQAGLLLFYNRRLYCGLGFSAAERIMHRQGLDRYGAKPSDIGQRFFICIENNRHIVTIHTSPDGANWTKFDTQMEVSGYHHNTAYDFLSLRPALYVAGQGAARFRNFKYEAL
ncbi:MAG: family 43 glycosylhydrolase [Terricaulis silvestris]